VQVTAYTLPGDEANGKIVLGIAARALTEFGKRFGAYPWTELSVVEQPLSDGAGGIEYPTVIGVASLVYRSQQSMGSLGALFGPQQKLGSHSTNVGFSDKLIEFAVAHEVAHQWWSSLVGSDPHQHPALDEALAQYSAVLYVESKRGKAASLEAQKTQVAVNFQMIRQSGEEDGAVDRPTEAFASPLQYAGLVYGKAPLFFPAARKLLGDAAFNQMLRRYADTHRLGEAGPGDLVRAGAAVAPAHARALEKLHARWFDEKHGDEDVGPMDMGALIEATTGLQISPQEKAMMQQLMPQLMQMMHDGADPAVVDPSGP
jgi:aminopeptidase N